MDLQSNLIESQKLKKRGRWKASLGSLAAHGLIVAFIVFMTATASHKVNAEDKIMKAFMVSNAAPPPPPPPPPPPAGSPTPRVQPTVKPVVQQPSFVQPTEIPKELPKIESTGSVDTTPAQSNQPAGEPGGVAGGVAGGVVGGVQGGVVGGVVGGVLGGTLGGTGTGEAAPPPPPPPPPPVPDGPVRVGGDVKAPIAIKRVEPQYTEVARKARIQGVVILEAIIDKDGNVDHVKVLRGLAMGLSEKAEEAVKSWKFRPGTMNGQPVDVIFNLVVHFTLDGKAVASSPPTSTE